MKKFNCKKVPAYSVQSTALVGGFTLIELLVVVAIIGILASVVLASLNNARVKGVDAAIKANMSSARSQASLFYDDNNEVYTNICSDPTGIGIFVLSAVQKLNLASIAVGGNTDAFAYDVTGVSLESSVCHDSDTDWAAITSLKGGGGTGNSGWCVDSAGASREATVLLAGEVVCP